MLLSRRVPRAFLLPAMALIGALVAVWAPRFAAAQDIATSTPFPINGPAYITNTFEGEPHVNVRTGPDTILYPVPCGFLPYGESAEALGATPPREWVQIRFSACPGGIGWVYAANVTLNGGVNIVEPPPTPTPLATATLDPTLVAAFETEPTLTRLPTFTPPAPLSQPTFVEESRPVSGFPVAPIILVTALLGGAVLAASFIGRP